MLSQRERFPGTWRLGRSFRVLRRGNASSLNCVTARADHSTGMPLDFRLDKPVSVHATSAHKDAPHLMARS